MIGLLLGAAIATTAATVGGEAPVLPLAQCLRANRIDHWLAVEERALLIKSGTRYFRVAMHDRCPKLGEGGVLTLQGAQVTREFICGDFGEKVATRLGECRVGSVTPLARDAFLKEVDEMPVQ
jgi:hypothetical protein